MTKSDADFLREMTEELKAAIDINILQEQNEKLRKKNERFLWRIR